MDLGISGQSVLITGAGDGIGAACARAFADERCRVVVADIAVKSAERVADAINQGGGQALALEMDVSRADSIRSCIGQANAIWGGIDVLVNNAGFSRDSEVHLMSDEQWQSVIDVNLTGQFRCIREVAPFMRRRKSGRIINMASRAHLGDLNKSNYAASKAGVIGMTKALSIELAPQGITVNAIAPGVVETERLKNLPHFDALKTRAFAGMPVQRLGQPQEVAALALFLASTHAGFISGEVVHISGGRFG